MPPAFPPAFFFSFYRPHRVLHSFPTRRSSDPRVTHADDFGLCSCLDDEVIQGDRKSTRLNSSHRCISYAVFCLKKKTTRLRTPCRRRLYVLSPATGCLVH